MQSTATHKNGLFYCRKVEKVVEDKRRCLLQEDTPGGSQGANDDYIGKITKFRILTFCLSSDKWKLSQKLLQEVDL